MLTRDRQRRVLVLEALERRVKQFRSREDSWPFRMPHEPLDLAAIIGEALTGEGAALPAEALRSRAVLRLEWASGDVWELWAASLPSGVQVYCDSDGIETFVLGSARRGNPSDADGFFLERLAESRGEVFGIEMAGPPPERVKSAIGDRDFLADVFVELFEGTDAEAALRTASPGPAPDFRAVVVAWLDRALSAPPLTRRQPRVRDEDPSL
jgi:hypothetical protein